MADTLSRFTVELDGKKYVLEAPSDATEDELLAAIQSAPTAHAENPATTPQSAGGDLPDGPPKLEDDVQVDLPNVPQDPDQSDPNFDPAAGTPLNVATEEPTAPAVDANLGQADTGNRARALVTGALPSFEDELEGMYRTYRKDKPGISFPFPLVPGGNINLGMPWGEDYTRERNKVRDDFGLYQQRNPVESLSLETGGALAASLIPGMGALGEAALAGRVASPGARALALGTGVGALSGAGSADEMGDVPLAMLKSGAVGAIASPLAMLGGKGVSGASRWVANRVSPAKVSTAEEAAGDVLHAALRRAKLTPDELATKIAEDRARGIPAMAGDYMVDSADAALRVPSEGRAEHLSDLFNRQINARERTQSQINTAFGNPQEYFDTEEKLLNAGRSRANTVYNAAYAVGDVRDPRIIEMLKGKNMKKFWARAQEIADLDAEAAVARGEDPAPYRLKPLFEVVDDGTEHSAIKRTGAVPDVRTLDYLKKGMSDEIDGLYKGTSSAGKQQATGLKELYKAFVKRVDEVVPEYKAARQVYAGDMEVRDALEAGRSINKLVPAQVSKLVKDASAGELDALRTGAYEGLRALVDNRTTNSNWAKIFAMPGKMRDNLRAILPKKEFDLLQTIFKREGEIFATSGSRMAGSQTIGRGEAVADIDRVIQESDVIGTAKALGSHSGRIAAVIDFHSSKMANPEKRDRVYTLLNKVYRAGHPDDIMEALELLNATSKTATAAGRTNEAVTPRVGAALGSALGTDPTPGGSVPLDTTSNFTPVADEEDQTTEMPATEEGGTATDIPFQIPPTGVPEVDAVIPQLMHQETRGGKDMGAVSPAGAEGLMQIMPETQRNPGFGLEPLKDASVKENLRLGTQYLAALYQNYGSDMTLALMAYNWGPDNVDNWLKGGKKSAVPQETKNYVRGIIGTEIQ